MASGHYYKVLSIAGFDGSGGAGMQADMKTFSALKCYGMTVLTALAVQNTVGVRTVYEISADCVQAQLHSIFDDIEIHAVKIGMLHRRDIVKVISNILASHPVPNIVLDPVMIAKSGNKLLDDNAVQAMIELLFPLTMVLTPNLWEASKILGRKIETKKQMERAAQDIASLGPKYVIVKGGHLRGDCEDCLYAHHELHWFSSPKIQTQNTHGTGCTFSAAITSYLARGFDIKMAVQYAKQYLTRAIDAGKSLKIGHGHGPVHHFHYLWEFL